MTVLAAPQPHICQLDLVDPDRREACGPCCVAMIECAYGTVTAGTDVEQWLRTRYGEGGVHSGTTVDELLAYVAERGLGQQCTHVGRDLGAISAALSAGVYVLAFIKDDINGNPDAGGPFEHFVVLLGVDGGAATVANPWHRSPSDGGPLNRFFAALIDAVAIAPAPAPAPAEDDDMQQVIITDKFGHMFRGDGSWVEYIETVAELRDIEWVAENVFHKPVIFQGDATTPAPDVLAFGACKTAKTAAVLGVPFP